MKFLKILFFLCFTLPAHGQDTLDWFFFHPIKKEWINAGQFGSVQESLIKIGELPDPFVGLNETKFDWIEDYEWEFKSTFYSDSITLSKHKIEMCFPWIDTYAKVFLNDSLILETSNSFRPYFVQIKDYLKLGENNLKVVFTPPILKHLTTASENGITYPAPNDIGKVQIAPLVRKPQYQFGWDWSMRMNTIGFIKPVSIRSYDLAKIKTTQIELDEVIDDTAIMNLNMYLTESISGDYLIESNYLGPLNNIEIQNGKLFLSFYITNPKLWWPRGQGDSHLYVDTIFLKTKYGKIVDSTIIQFGIRKSELIQEKDSVGVSYYFKINNRPIFCKGANVIPMDIFPSRITREKM
jgi:beta-mannosidase